MQLTRFTVSTLIASTVTLGATGADKTFTPQGGSTSWAASGNWSPRA